MGGASLGLHLYATAVAAATFLLVLAGGLVTGTGSALAVPDWPLAYGQFFPRMTGGVLFEHGHRMVAGTVGFLTVILAAWVWLKDPRPGVKRLGLWAVAAVTAQALLGGITVLYRLPPAVSVAHACLGQIFFCMVVCLAVLTRDVRELEITPPFEKGRLGGISSRQIPLNPPFSKGEDERRPSFEIHIQKLRRLALMTVGFIFVQAMAGATLRHTGQGLHAHLLGAFLVAVHVSLLMRRTLQEGSRRLDLRLLAGFLTSLLGIQILLGISSWRTGAVAVTTAHVGVGALMLACSAVLAMQTFRAAEVVA